MVVVSSSILGCSAKKAALWFLPCPQRKSCALLWLPGVAGLKVVFQTGRRAVPSLTALSACELEDQLLSWIWTVTSQTCSSAEFFHSAASTATSYLLSRNYQVVLQYWTKGNITEHTVIAGLQLSYPDKTIRQTLVFCCSHPNRESLGEGSFFLFFLH